MLRSASWATPLLALKASTIGTQYRDEKADALKRLAQQIMDIVVPPPRMCGSCGRSQGNACGVAIL